MTMMMATLTAGPKLEEAEGLQRDRWGYVTDEQLT